MNIGELFVKLGVKADTNKLENFDKGMKDAKQNALALKLAVIGVAIAMKKIASASIEAAVGLKNFSIQTGLSRDELQKWRYVADQNDISGQELIATIKGIQQAQAAIRLGAGNIKPFQLLGISPTEDPFKVLDQLRDKIKGLDPAIATNVLSQLGVGQNFLNILKKGNLEFSKLNKQFLITTKEQDKLIRFNKAFKETIFLLRGLRDKFIALISPAVISFLKAVGNSLEVVLETGKGLGEIIGKFKTLSKIVAIVGSVILAFFAPITAAIAGVILVIDDLYTYIKGGESLFGLFVENIKKIFEGLQASIEKVFNFIKSGYEKYILPIIETMEGILNNSFVAKFIGNEGQQIPSGATNNTANNTNNININLHGVQGDPKEIAKTIEETLDKQNLSAYYNRQAVGV